MWRSSRAVLLLCALLALGACRAAEPAPQPIAPFERVILVTLDTLRADHLGSHGYPRGTSPFLDELARRGVQFLSAYASMPTTAPAHASLFTALHPFEHNVLQNGHELHPDLLSLPDLFAGADFQRAAFTSVTFLERGLASRFDLFDAAHSPGRSSRIASETIDRALAWIADRVPAERFFLWIHLFDPHEYWQNTLAPPQHVAAMRLDQDAKPRASLAHIVSTHDLPPGSRHPESPALQQIQRYDAQIHFVDQQLARFYSVLEERGLAADSLWVLTADHGEGLGNHGYDSHGSNLYNEALHVPLIFHSPRPDFPRHQVSELVRHIDVLPTLAEIMELPLAPEGYAPSGRSLLPLLEGREDAPRHAFAQRFDMRRPPERGTTHAGHGDVYALQDGRFKYIHAASAADEFYDLASDPREKHDRIGSSSRPQERLRAMLDARFTPRFHQPVFAQIEERPLDPETREELRALGYLP